MRKRTAVIGALLTLVVAGATLSACGGDDSDASSATTAAATASTANAAASSTTADPYGYGSTATTAAATPATTATTAAAAAAAATVQLADTSLGKVLVDSKGMTLYLFTKDTKGQPSVCANACLTAWPALTGAAPTAGTGVDASKLSVINRPDGTPQVAYAGWPLYYYAEDAQPGDVNGQGSNKVWFVLDASGAAIPA
jgi:predicted lipoprotein with Yx(FWY)xxD motif